MTRTNDAFLKRLEAMRAQVGKDRDRLRELINEYEDLLGSCERAKDALDDAVAALSECV